MKTLDHLISELPAGRRAKVERRARELIGEEMALQQLRKAKKLTQKQIARSLKIGQDSVSRLESRSDLLISTLQGYVAAMGGSLRIVAEFKEGSATLSGLGIPEAPERSAPAKKTRPTRKRQTESAL